MIKTNIKKLISFFIAVIMVISNALPLTTVSFADTLDQSDTSYAYGSYSSLIHTPVSLGNGEYQQVEYLQSTGTQYCNLGSLPNILTSEYKGLGSGALWGQSILTSSMVKNNTSKKGSSSANTCQAAIWSIKKGLYADSGNLYADFGDRINTSTSGSRYSGSVQIGSLQGTSMWSTEKNYLNPFKMTLGTSTASYNDEAQTLNNTLHYNYKTYGWPMYWGTENWTDWYGDGYITQAQNVPYNFGGYLTNYYNGNLNYLSYRAPVYLMAGSNSPTSLSLAYSNSICFGFTFTVAGGTDWSNGSWNSNSETYPVNSSTTSQKSYDLVPCYRISDNVAGYYDCINNNFYSNSGTGTFICGPNVGTATVPTVSVSSELQGYYHQPELALPITATTEFGQLTYTWYRKAKNQLGLWDSEWSIVAQDVALDGYYVPTEECYPGTETIISEFKYYATVKSTYSGTSVSKDSDEIHVSLQNGVYIIFMLNSEDVYKKVYGEDGSEITPPADPVQTGYTFEGWYTDDYYTQEVTTFDSSLNKVYAKWSVNEYPINYHLSGGTNNEENEDYHTYGTVTKLYNPTYSGRKFTGWYTDSEYTNKVTFLSKDGYSSQIDLYAEWEMAVYNIYYILDGGNNHQDNPSTTTYDTKVILKNPSREHYTFMGWFDNSSYTGSQISILAEETVTDDVYLYAKWAGLDYAINYNLDGGENNESNPVSFEYGKTSKLYNPTKIGYTFKGWYTDPGKETQITEINGSSYNEDLTLYAKWEANVYEVIYKLDDGLNSDSNPAYHTYGTTDTLYAPTKTGYEFKGWYTDKDFTDNPVTELSATAYTDKIHLYAQWKATKNSYCVNYNVEDIDGKGYKIKSTKYFEGQINETVYASPITIEGFTYKESINSEESYGVLKANTELILNLYYTRNSYSIIYFNGVNDSTTKTFKYEELINSPSFERTNYTFLGFSPALPSRMPSANLSVTCLWEKENTSQQQKITLAEKTYYKVYINTPEDYNCSVSQSTSTEGELITIYCNPSTDIEITDLYVTTLQQSVRTGLVASNTFEFIMPDAHVYILASDNGNYSVDNPNYLDTEEAEILKKYENINEYKEEKVEDVSMNTGIVEESVPKVTESINNDTKSMQKETVKLVVGATSTVTGLLIGNALSGIIGRGKYSYRRRH